MPTLPSTLPAHHGDVLASACTLPDPDDALSGPTPDPDLDELVLVPVVTGDVGAITHHASLAAAVAHDDDAVHSSALKPHLSLSNLSLHSPSSILGTPFDVSSPRFEYPFPPAAPPEPELTLPPSILAPLIPFAVTGPPCALSVPPASLPISISVSVSASAHTHAHSRSYSPTHPKHLLRDPPVPPTLAKKRKGLHSGGGAPDAGAGTGTAAVSGGGTALSPSRRRTRSSSLAVPPEQDAAAGRAEKTGTLTLDLQRRAASKQPTERVLRPRETPASHGSRVAI